MNYSLAREVYGNSPWMVDRATFSTLFNILKDFRNGVEFDGEGEKLNSSFLYDFKNATRIVTDTYALRNNDQQDSLIYVINLNGAITKNGGESSYGTKQLSQQIVKFDNDPNVIGGIILTDSGGGSSSGMEFMAHTLQNVKKPVVGLIERGGMAASAAYGILSNTKWIMAESKDATVGSIGTMVSFSAHPNKSIDGDGAKHITIYASASTKKNLAFEEAINNDNYDLIISELLDPSNKRFIQSVKSNRPNVLESQLDGSVYDSGDVVGTLIDAIGDFGAAVNKVKELSGKKITIKNNNQTTAMTAQELLAQHPAVHAEVFGAGRTAGIQAGIAAEKDRTGAWMAHIGTDAEAVKKGIEGGGEITATAREEFLIKSSAKGKLEALKENSATATVVQEAATVEPTEAEAFYAKVNGGLKK